jgi:predicted ATPase
VISGCSGGGKSTLLEELKRRGHMVIEDPGRRIVRDELNSDGSALPWIDAAAFAKRLVQLCLEDRLSAESQDGWVFFDRGLIDAAAAYEHLTGEDFPQALLASNPYYKRVFLVPPWPELFVGDRERRHSFEDALAEHDRLAAIYPKLGYEPMYLPKASVEERADFLLLALVGRPPPPPYRK